ncbi:unnamed protein product [Didymodactylos carnosus]|uniref:Uncharacterized protein n=1 Tax=Didymodactylos carnosus TaxID=1234261 RepID=A0A8S3A5X8_9BILA|nr:unnamed protein product [Didymodactylos carnosus]
MLDWLKSDFEELDLQAKETAAIKRNSQTTQSQSSINLWDQLENSVLDGLNEEEVQEQFDEDAWTHLEL